MPRWTVATWIPRHVVAFVLAVALNAVAGLLEGNRVAWAATITVTSAGDTVTPGDITVALTSIPTSIVTVTPVFDTAQVGVVPNSIIFQPDATALNPQNVAVSAVDDALLEGDHSRQITFTVPRRTRITPASR